MFDLNADPLNSPLVRRLAFEELFRFRYLEMPHDGDRGCKKAMAAISARAATLRANPDLVRSVYRLMLNLDYDDNSVKNYDVYDDITLDSNEDDKKVV